MQKYFGARPPRYAALVWLTLRATLIRAIAFLPFAVAYILPQESWMRLILIAWPVLWIVLVCPARCRYAKLLTAFVQDDSVSLRMKAYPVSRKEGAAVCRGHFRRVLPWAAPAILLLLLLAVLWFVDAFTALRIIMSVFSSIAGVFVALPSLLSNLISGEAVYAQTGALGAFAALAVIGGISIGLLAVGLFRWSGYRYGKTDRPMDDDTRKALARQNLRLWLPTLVLLLALTIVSGGEIGLMLANMLSASAVYSAKLSLPGIIVLGVTLVSYILLLPLRRLNTARAVNQSK